jgi:hypothetical protein
MEAPSDRGHPAPSALVACPHLRALVLRTDAARRERRTDWKGSVAKIESSDHRIAGRKRPIARPADGCAHTLGARRSCRRITLPRSAGSTRRPPTGTRSAGTRLSDGPSRDRRAADVCARSASKRTSMSSTWIYRLKTWKRSQPSTWDEAASSSIVTQRWSSSSARPRAGPNTARPRGEPGLARGAQALRSRPGSSQTVAKTPTGVRFLPTGGSSSTDRHPARRTARAIRRSRASQAEAIDPSVTSALCAAKAARTSSFSRGGTPK